MNLVVIVYCEDSQWRWRMLGTSGRVMRSSSSTFPDRDDAVTSAYVENPGVPVEVDLLFSSAATA